MQDNINGIASIIGCYRLPGLGKYLNKVSMAEYSILSLKCDYRITYSDYFQNIYFYMHSWTDYNDVKVIFVLFRFLKISDLGW